MNSKSIIQENDAAALDYKIAAAFSRISQAMRTLAWKAGGQLNLNPAQQQILVFLSHYKSGSSISSLAKEFGITKASISDTINLLQQKNFITKTYSQNTMRRFTVSLTADGRQAVRQVQDGSTQLYTCLQQLHEKDRQSIFPVLTEIIYSLYKSGAISTQRMCHTCIHYKYSNRVHHCRLLAKNLPAHQLQINCPEHCNV